LSDTSTHPPVEVKRARLLRRSARDGLGRGIEPGEPSESFEAARYGLSGEDAAIGVQ